MTAGRADRRQVEEAATDDYLEVPDIFGGEEGDFLIQVAGATSDSAGILKDDYVVVRPVDEPEAGAIVVAVAGNGEEAGAVVFKAGREPNSEVELIGKAIAVVRKI